MYSKLRYNVRNISVISESIATIIAIGKSIKLFEVKNLDMRQMTIVFRKSFLVVNQLFFPY